MDLARLLNKSKTCNQNGKEWLILSDKESREFLRNETIRDKWIADERNIGLSVNSDDDRFFDDIVQFQERIKRVVLNKSTIVDLLYFMNVYEFIAIDCPNIKDVYSLGNVHTVVFQTCQNIYNIASLYKTKILIVDDSMYVTWATPPPSLERLEIIKHDEIPLDVSCLGNIPSLTICTNGAINNMQVLKNEHIKLLLCPKVSNFSDLKNVKHVTIDSCDMFENSNDLSNAETVTINFCHRITGIRGCMKAKRIEMCWCSKVSTIQVSKNVQEIVIENCPNLIDIEMLKYVPFVTIKKCDNIKSYSALSNAESVRLSCSNITNTMLEPLEKVKSLYLYSCDNITDISSVEHVPTISINSCDNIKNLHLIKNRYGVTINNDVQPTKSPSMFKFIIEMVLMILLIIILSKFAYDYIVEHSESFMFEELRLPERGFSHEYPNY
jgi:hypothetical protein